MTANRILKKFLGIRLSFNNMFTEGEGVKDRDIFFLFLFFHTIQTTFSFVKNQDDKIVCAPMKSG